MALRLPGLCRRAACRPDKAVTPPPGILPGGTVLTGPTGGRLLCRRNIRHFRMCLIRFNSGGRRRGHDVIPRRL
ncbi:hypothetical protein DUQ00_02200 [Salmonella bongori]|nr:hypothetical protein [Salmonella bongori]ECC9595172.1 hypothetical protein [Salmonella bongori]